MTQLAGAGRSRLEFLHFPGGKLTREARRSPPAGWKGRSPRRLCRAVPPRYQWASDAAHIMVVRPLHIQVELSEQESQACPVGSWLSAANSGRTANLQDSSAPAHDIKIYS
jgi:hypothetical protein